MLRPNRKQRVSKNPGPIDRRRWFMHIGLSMTVEEIANQEDCNPVIVQRSIDCCKEYRYRCSNEMVALRVNEVVLGQLAGVGTVFGQGLKAKKLVPAGHGEYKSVADIAMRLKTVETMKSLQEISQPRAPVIQNNAQFNNNFPGGGSSAPGMSFEARLRIARERRGMVNDEAANVIDAEEADIDQTLDEEMEDMGIDLNENEGEDEATS